MYINFMAFFADVSMFQRLYSSYPYLKDSKAKVYNQRFISKLKNNYRSHPKLVAVPNQLFYNNEIRSSANPGKIKSLRLTKIYIVSLKCIN